MPAGGRVCFSCNRCLGALVIPAIAFAFSEHHRAVSWRRVLPAMALTVVLAVLLVKDSGPASGSRQRQWRGRCDCGGDPRRHLLRFRLSLAAVPCPSIPNFPGSEFVLAFQALPLVLVMSVLTTLLFYWRILPPIVRGFSWALERTLGIGGAVGLSTAANIFVGMVEAPLFIRPYLARLTRAELFIVMTGGMAGIAGTVLVLYATILRPLIPDVAAHLLDRLGARGSGRDPDQRIDGAGNAGRRDRGRICRPAARRRLTMDAIVKGTTEGLALLLNIVAMLIVLVALVHLANSILGLFPDIAGGKVTLQRVLGIVMAPICWLMGLPWSEAIRGGELMGIKTVLNELIAYVELSKLPADALSDRSRLIMLYALCGFANFGSLGIMIAGLTTMAPERRDEIVSLGPKTIVSGTLATCTIGAIVGALS